jgi:spermidine synthase
VVFGRWRQRPFAVFALVELALGAYAISSYHVLAPLATLLAHAFGSSIADAEGLRTPVIIACVLFLLPPCVLMGGTLPLIFNCFIRTDETRSAPVGLLYGLNTLGAALGVLAAPFVLLNRRSIPSTLGLVGAGNLLLGLAIWWYGSRAAPLVPLPPRETAVLDHASGPRAALLALGFLSGFITLGFEISLFRAFAVFNPSSPYNFPGVLLPFLVSIAAGSIVLTRFDRYTTARALRRVGVLFLLAVTGMLLGVLGSVALSTSEFRWTFRQSPFGPLAGQLHGLLVYGLVTIVPCVFFLSGVFPLLLRLAAPTGQSLPAATGRLSLVNAVGAFTGAVLAQFVGFPRIGTRGVVSTLALLGVGAGAFCLWRTATRRRDAVLFGTLVPALATALLLIPPGVWDLYTFGRTGPNVDRVEGATGVASIEWGRFRGRVFVNGQSMSALPDHPTHVQLVSFALALPRRERVLLLGLGGGGMVRELAADPGVARIDVVDWSHELPLVLDSPRARDVLADSLRDPKVRLYRCDARVAVGLYDRASFDVVIDNLTHAHWVGATNVKSQAYFAKIRRIVKPSGVFVYHGNYANARDAILAGLVRTFPVVREHGSRVVFASEQPVEIDRTRAQAVLEPRAREIGLAITPYSEWLLTDWRSIFRADLAQRPVRDDLLIHEYQFDPLAPLFGARRR